MIKVITTLKRRQGMSVKDFRNYYENHHRIIGEKYLSGFATRYIRRYTTPLPGSEWSRVEPEFDVLLEIWFSDEAAFQACNNRLSEPEVAQEIVHDEEKLFERRQKRSYIVNECESAMDTQSDQ